MRLAAGALARTTTGLNVRLEPGGAITATLQADVLVRLLAEPLASGWVQVEAGGWTQDGKTWYFEPDVDSGVKLTRGGWRYGTVSGFVAGRYLAAVDGPL